MARGGDGITFRCGEKVLETQINAHLLARADVFNMPLSFYSKLAVVAIGTPHDAYPLDKLDGIFLYPLSLVAHQPERANATAIGKGEVLAIRFQSPARLLVFH